MPCVKTKSGYKIRRSAGGLYPKIYVSLRACKERAKQMEKFKRVKKK